jgi:hypothetical protein
LASIPAVVTIYDGSFVDFFVREWNIRGSVLALYRSFVAAQYSIALSFNVFTDYLSLFVIRWLLSRTGTKAVVGLILAAISGSAIVLLANVLRAITFFIQLSAWFGHLKIFWENVQDIFFGIFYSHMHYALPAIIVFPGCHFSLWES